MNAQTINTRALCAGSIYINNKRIWHLPIALLYIAWTEHFLVLIWLLLSLTTTFDFYFEFALLSVYC